MSLPGGSDGPEAVPLVSFLVVAHNAGPYLAECAESICAQTHPRLEIVLVDNASADGSVEALRADWEAAVARGAPPRPPLRVLRSTANLGPASGAVMGLPHCGGEFIARLDADDVALPERIAEQVVYLRRHPGRDAVGADAIRITSDGLPWRMALSLRGDFTRRRSSKWELACIHTTLTLRRSAALARFYNPTFFAAEDFELMEWMARTGRLGAIPRVLGLYRNHAFSITRRLGDLQRLSSCELRLRLSEATGREDLRRAIGSADFSYLLTDPRVLLKDRQRAQLYEELSRARRDWLAAAYFASIGKRWLRLPKLLLAALAAGQPAGEIAAFLVARIYLPAWRRFHEATFRMFLRLSGPLKSSATGGDNLRESIRIARRWNRLPWRRSGPR